MFGFTLVRKATLAALEDESHLLRSSGYFVRVSADGKLEKGYGGKVEITYAAGHGPWRKSPSYRKIR